MKREFKATGFAKSQKNATQYIMSVSFSFFIIFFDNVYCLAAKEKTYGDLPVVH